MARRGALLVLTACALACVPQPAGANDSLEARVLVLVNGGRAHKLVPHAGLKIAARRHAKAMAAGRGLSHDGAAGRISSVPSDPAQPDGAPDNGYAGTWCENLALVTNSSDGDVPRRIYEGWTRSASHNRCMNERHMNAAGVGMYFDGRTWWAALELMVDRTLPGTSSRVAATKLAAEPPPPRSTSPSVDPSSGQSPVPGADAKDARALERSVEPVSARPASVWPQIAFVGLLGLALLSVIVALSARATRH